MVLHPLLYYELLFYPNKSYLNSTLHKNDALISQNQHRHKSFQINSTYRIEKFWINEQKSFGIAYCYNYKALENILNGRDDILYCLNDFTFWGKADVFKKLKTLF